MNMISKRIFVTIAVLLAVENVKSHDEHQEKHAGYEPKDYSDHKPSNYDDVPKRPYPPPKPDHGYEEEGCYRYPSHCKPGLDCDYEASWESRAVSDYVYFTISARVPRGYWAGIGFSEDKSMVDSDCVTGWITGDGGLALYDRYLIGKTPASVPVDKYKDVYPISHIHKNGMMEFQFKRRRNTYDRADKSLEHCVYFLFAWGGEGQYGGGITAHTKKFVSKNLICLGSIYGDVGQGAYSSSSYPKYEYLQRPMEYHYDPCRRANVCRRNEICIPKGNGVKCKCPYGYQDRPEGCIKVSAFPYSSEIVY